MGTPLGTRPALGKNMDAQQIRECEERRYERLKRGAIDDRDLGAAYELVFSARRRGDNEFEALAQAVIDAEPNFTAYMAVIARSGVYGWKNRLIEWLESHTELSSIQARQVVLRRADAPLVRRLPCPEELNGDLPAGSVFRLGPVDLANPRTASFSVETTRSED